MSTDRDRGVALLLVLLFVTLLTAIVVSYCYETRVEAAMAANHASLMEAHAAAKSAIAMGMSLLQADLDNLDGTGGGEFDALTDVWATGVPFQELNRAVMQCTVADEYGKINLSALLEGPDDEPNEVLEAALRMLFELRGVEEDPVDAILDWMDRDDEPRMNGAETDFYAAREIAVGCKNAPMDSLEELLMVPGITPDVFFGDPELEQSPLTELLTVRGHPSGKINANTAERETLDALGEALGRTGLGEIVIAARDQAPFESVDDLRGRGILEPQSRGEGASADPLDVASRVFRIRGDGLARQGKVRIEAYVRREPHGGAGAFRVLDWRVIQ